MKEICLVVNQSLHVAWDFAIEIFYTPAINAEDQNTEFMRYGQSTRMTSHDIYHPYKWHKAYPLCSITQNLRYYLANQSPY